MDILYLPGWTALSLEEQDDCYLIRTVPTLPFSTCPHCGSVTLVKHGTDSQQIRDLPIHGKRVLLCVDHQRYRCTACKRTCYHPLEALDIKRLMTTRLVRYIERKAISTNRTFVSISEEIGVDPRTIRNIFDDAVQVMGETATFETPTILGIDELHVLGAPRAIFTNISARTVIEFLEDRKKQSVIHALRQLKRPDNVRTCVTDMWRPYRDSIQTVLPDAVLVCDKFHVLKLVTAALEKFREISQSLTENQRKTLKMHDRYLLLRRLHDLSPEVRFILESWTGSFPLLGQAHQLKEEFFSIYDHQTKAEAEAAYFAWLEHIPRELQHIYYPVMHTIEEWCDPIFAHFDQGHITGGFVESANSVARCLSRMGRGYSLPVLRARLLYGMKGVRVDSTCKGIAISTLIGAAEAVATS